MILSCTRDTMELLRRSWACTNVSVVMVKNTFSFIELFLETYIYYTHNGLSRIYNLSPENILAFTCIDTYIYIYVYISVYVYTYIHIYIYI